MRIRREWVLGLGAAGLGLLLMTRAARTRSRYDFSGRAVLITGGSRGLGLVMARQLAAEGARLTLIARDKADLERAAGDLLRRSPSTEVLTVQADVRRREDVERAVAESAVHYGRVDVAFNNAGIIQVGPLEHMTVRDYEDAMNTHFWGSLYLILAVLPHMRRQKHGRIVNIASIGGKVAVPHMLPYSSSKFALTGLSEGLRSELARENIIVTTVCPGLMRTGSPVNAMFKGKREKEYAWFAVSDSLPVVTISAERAAAQIIAACRRGEAELVITLAAKLAVLAHALVPELFSHAMTIVNQLLPSTAEHGGNEARPGRASTSRWTTSPLTAPMYEAARRNNEL